MLWPFGIIYDRLVQFVVVCYIFSRFGIFEPRKIWQPLQFAWRPKETFFSHRACEVL
jgi:uncharacterized metal-binding protein